MNNLSELLLNYISKSSNLIGEIHSELPRTHSKCYTAKHRIKLPLEFGLMKKPIERLSYFLYTTYGVLNWEVINGTHLNHPYISKFRRAVPSGGGIYPNELYIYIGMNWGFDEGIYHYHPLNHELLFVSNLLKKEELIGLISLPYEKKDDDILLFISCLLDKNSYKYRDLSYRIQCLDSGIVLSRASEVAKGIGCAVEISFIVDESNIRGAINLPVDEGIMAVMVIKGDETINIDKIKVDKTEYRNHETTAIYPFKQRSEYFPFLRQIHDLTCELLFPIFNRRIVRVSSQKENSTRYPLPKSTNTFNMPFQEYKEQRKTAFHHFLGGTIPLQAVSNILGKLFLEFENDLGSSVVSCVRIILYCNDVEDIHQGLYEYDHINHNLIVLNKGDFQKEFRDCIIQPDLDIHRVGITFFLIGNYSDISNDMKNSTYRILNLLAGIITERLFYGACTQKLGKYPFLSYNIDKLKFLLNLDTDMYPLIIFFMGHEQKKSLHLKFPIHL